MRFDYGSLLRGVARDVLSEAAELGLEGDHPGVVVPLHIAEEHPVEMVIVLQHQFWDLTVDEELFSVSLRFNGRLERVVVPWAAVLRFVDPSVPIGFDFAWFRAGAPAPVEAELPERDDGTLKFPRRA